MQQTGFGTRRAGVSSLQALELDKSEAGNTCRRTLVGGDERKSSNYLIICLQESHCSIRLDFANSRLTLVNI